MEDHTGETQMGGGAYVGQREIAVPLALFNKKELCHNILRYFPVAINLII